MFENIQGFNLYAYCYNNPVMYVDYDGEDAAAILEQWNQEAANLSQMDGPYLFGDLIAGCGYVVVGCIFAYEAIAGWFNAADDTPTDESDAPKNIDDENNSKSNNNDEKKDLPIEGSPNSDQNAYDENGLRQTRHYGPDGKAEYDIDYNHGGVGHKFPHRHNWDWSKKPPRGKAIDLY